jgi:nucleoside-diphosphate-sugar epimerase
MAVVGEPMSLYGDGVNVRDLLDVEDDVDALRLAATRAALVGLSYFVGGHGDCINKQVVEAIRCEAVRQRAGDGGRSTWRNTVDTASSTPS